MCNFIRASILCTAFFALAGQSPAPERSTDEGSDFCTRLGRNIGLEEPILADTKAGWKSNALNFGQRFLVGGTATTSVAVEPSEPATVQDYKRANGMCITEGKGVVCRLAGPVNFSLGWKGSTTITPVLPNEKAVVRVEGIKTNCEPDGSL